MCASINKRPWFERVFSAHNIADGISRGDMSIAHREQWQRLNFYEDAFFNEVMRVAVFPNMAVRPAGLLLEQVRQAARPSLAVIPTATMGECLQTSTGQT